jgi:hypothetical protein
LAPRFARRSDRDAVEIDMLMRDIVRSLALMAALGSVAVAQRSAPARLTVEGRSSANPSIAALGDVVAITWSAATVSAMDVYAALSRDGGVSFSRPVRVNNVAGDARVNSEQPPRVALVPRPGRDPEVVVVWTTRVVTSSAPDTAAVKGKGTSPVAGAGRGTGPVMRTRIMFARSTDGLRTFAAPHVVPGTDAEGSRGWQSVAVDSAGRVVVLWLDHRYAAHMPMSHSRDSSKKTADTTVPKMSPSARAQLSKLYVGTLDGSGGSMVWSGVCYCCKTSLIAAGSSVYAAWRHVFQGGFRDIAFTELRDGGRSFSSVVRVSADGWKIDGCPENGPALAADASRRIHVVWPTPPDGKTDTPLGLFYANTSNATTFSPRAQIPTNGPAAHAQIVIGLDGQPIVAWDEIVAGARRIALAGVRGDGSSASFVPIASPTKSADQGWPALASTTGGTVLAWVNKSGVGNSIDVVRLK